MASIVFDEGTLRVARPFIKMAGGKTKLLPELLKRVPLDFNGTYFEPFAGGAALLWALTNRFRGAVLSDTNFRLIRTYLAIQNSPEEVIVKLKRMKNTEKDFYRIRDKSPDEMVLNVEVAAWFIYLNKTCFNGLYRVNLSNVFNTPYGFFKKPAICDESNIRACSKALARVRIEHESYGEMLSHIKRRDFVYCDPPYLPLSATSSFTAYGPGGFGWAEHVRLTEFAVKVKEKGARILLSNSDHPRIRKLYKDAGFMVEKVYAPRSINATPGGRGKITELLIS